MSRNIPIALIAIDADTQSRVAIDEQTVNEYAETLEHGVVLPPIDVHFDGIRYIVTDGFHRYFAHKRINRKTIRCEVTEGTADDARWVAAQANINNGLRRTNADKRKAVTMALTVRGTMSNKAIADHCQVSDMLVAEVRDELDRAKSRDQVQELAPRTRRTGRDGKTYTSKSKAPAAPPPRQTKAKYNAQSPVAPTVKAGVATLHNDFVGRQIPAWLNPIWEGRDAVGEIIARLNDVRTGIEDAQNTDATDANPCLRRVAAGVMALIQKAEHEIKASLPYALCPVCQGADGGCKACGDGFMTREQYEIWQSTQK